ncbi:MAG TPA: hypothetical protein VGM67_01740 [Gemmatimonadaceae bacterium]
MFQWLADNRQWVFSGIGVFMLAVVLSGVRNGAWLRRMAARLLPKPQCVPERAKRFFLTPQHATLNISGPEDGYLRVEFIAMNSSGKLLCSKSAELSSLTIGNAGVQRDSQVNAHCDLITGATGTAQFTLILRPEEIRRVLEGIGPATNPLTSPYAQVHASGRFVVVQGNETCDAWFDYVIPTTTTVNDEAARIRLGRGEVRVDGAVALTH